MYPTCVRANAVGIGKSWVKFCGYFCSSKSEKFLKCHPSSLPPIGSMAARIGGVCSPLIISLYGFQSWLPGVLLTLLGLGAGLCSLKFPETYNKEMPNTFEDAQNLYNSR